MVFQVATVAVVAVLLTLMPATSFGDDRETELVSLISRLRSQSVKAKEAKHKVRTMNDNYHEVHYRLDYELGKRGKHLHKSRAIQLTPAERSALEDAVNEARRSVYASDMYLMRWNEKLASLAQQWSDRCHLTHGKPLFDSEDIGFFDLGQSNWAFQGSIEAQEVINVWMAEKKYYDVKTGDCIGGGCSHYRQLVWSSTTDFGCGLTYCDSVGNLHTDASLLVCYFGPPGNFRDELAYHPASRVSGPCSQCESGSFYCNNDLCDATCTGPSSTCVCKAACQNCGTVTSDCTCNCNPGSVGVDCSNLCTDSVSDCGTDYSDLCYLEFVGELCPATCKVCSPVNPCAGGPGPSGGAGGAAPPGGAGGAAPPGGQDASPEVPSGGSGPASDPAGDPSHSQTHDPSSHAPIDPSQNLEHGLTEAQKQRFLYLFNKHRSEAGASNMNKLIWNNQLARIAQEWSDNCVFEHRSLSTPGGHGYVAPASVGFSTTTLGENIWAFSDNSQFVPDKAVEEWYQEKDYYSFSSATCQPGKDCGHYIAMTWAYTREVGCGFTKCASVQAPGAVWPGGVMVSCNFAGGADMDKQPFKLGTPCTECASGHLYCTHNLCDDSCESAGGSGFCECNAKCNHGKPDAGCSCRCNKGYMGGQCDATCDNLVPECSRDWAFTECSPELLETFGFSFMYDKMVISCPKLCGRCEDGSERKASGHQKYHLARDSSEEEPSSEAAAVTEPPQPWAQHHPF